MLQMGQNNKNTFFEIYDQYILLLILLQIPPLPESEHIRTVKTEKDTPNKAAEVQSGGLIIYSGLEFFFWIILFITSPKSVSHTSQERETLNKQVQSLFHTRDFETIFFLVSETSKKGQRNKERERYRYIYIYRERERKKKNRANILDIHVTRRW